MRTFFSISVFIMLLLLGISLSANFVIGLEVFPHKFINPTSVTNETDALSQLTGLDDPSMNAVYLGVTSLSFLGVVALCYFTKQVSPLGLYIYGLVFWTAWIRLNSVLNFGGYVPVNFLVIFTIGIMFLFIASIIGLLTGGG